MESTTTGKGTLYNSPAIREGTAVPPGSIQGADLACRVDRLPKFENLKMVWNYSELITCRPMYRIDVRASHYNYRSRYDMPKQV